MELVDSSESESEDDEYRKIMLFTSTKRNLSDELEACVSSQEKVVPMEQASKLSLRRSNGALNCRKTDQEGTRMILEL